MNTSLNTSTTQQNSNNLTPKDFLTYDIYQGRFYTKKTKPKEVKPDEDGYLIFFAQGKRRKAKANKLAYELGTNTIIPKGSSILHRNLDKQDYRLCNLLLVPNQVMQTITEAHRNLAGDLKVQPHHTDMFSYVVTWVEHRQQKQKVLHDIATARRLLVRLQLKFAKTLGKYLVLD